MVNRLDFKQFVGMCFDRTFFVEVGNCSNHATDLDKHHALYVTFVAGGALRCEPAGIRLRKSLRISITSCKIGGKTFP